MRSGLWSVACVSLGLLTAACNLAQDQRYYREGIGNDLYWSGLPETTQLQQLYVGYICEQAGIPVESQSGSTLCDYGNFQPAYWATFVQAGMNDIDLRCDAYLSWLDDKKRTTQPILKQINDMSVVSQSIMRLTGVGADPITIVGLAFGLAADTFTNVRSRLLLEVNHSTVQTVVLGKQRDYRVQLLNHRIDNRPAAIHALRSYLRLCMPFTIEMEINNTVVVYERGGAGALANQPPLITPATVAPPFTPRQTIVRPVRLPPDTDPRYAEIIHGYNPASHTKTRVEPMLRAVCVPEQEVKNFGPYTKNLIFIAELFLKPNAPANHDRKLDRDEQAELSIAGDCQLEIYKNYFERRNFPGGTISKIFADLFDSRLPADQKLPPNPTLANSRKQISILRDSLGTRLRTNFEGFADQITPDMIPALRRSN